MPVRIGVRRWLKHRTLATTAVVTLALGIGSATALFSFVDAVILRPLPYPSPERLVLVWDTYPHWRGQPIRDAFWDHIPVSWPEYLDLLEHSRSFEALALHTPSGAVLRVDEPAELRGATVTASFLPMLGVVPIRGRGFSPDEDRADARVVILGYECWQTQFAGAPDIVGRAIQLDDRLLTVVGVLPRSVRFAVRRVATASEMADFWLPFGAITNPNDRARDNHSYLAVGRLKPGVTPEVALREVEPILRGAAHSARKSVRVSSLLDEELKPVRLPLLLLMAAAGLLLVIACVNVAGLLLADVTSRRWEFTVRAALGAARRQIAGQLLIEGAILGAAATALGVLLAYGAVPAIVALSPGNVPRLAQVAINLRALVFTTGLALLTVIGFSVAPAYAAARGNAGDALRSAGRSTSSLTRSRALALIVVAEVALTSMLLTGAGLLVKTLIRLQNTDVGFEPRNLLTLLVAQPRWRATDPVRTRTLYTNIAEQLSLLPGVRGVATRHAPLSSPASVFMERPLARLPNGRSRLACGWRSAPARGRCSPWWFDSGPGFSRWAARPGLWRLDCRHVRS